MMSDIYTYKDIFDRCKLLHPAVEQFIQNESKLHLAVTHVTSSLNTTLESIEDILKILEEKSDQTKECFQKILSHYTQLLSTLTCLESSLAFNVLTSLHKHNEAFKKKLSKKNKTNNKNTKKIKKNIKNKKKEIVKLRKKRQKEKSVTPDTRLEKATRELYSEYKDLGDLEEKKTKDMEEEEDTYLKGLMNNLKSVFIDEHKLLKSSEQVSAIIKVIDNAVNLTSKDEEVPEIMSEKSEKQQQDDETRAEPEPDVIERPQSPQSMGSRAGSFLSLSSFASYSFREENFSKDSRRDSQPLFSTVKRSPSPFGKVGQADLGRRREPRRKLDLSRPPLPPLPPVPPRTSHITESLTNLRQRLDEISGFHTASYSLNQATEPWSEQPPPVSSRPPLVPRSAYMEDGAMRELSYKLRSLSATASAVSTPECPDLEAGPEEKETASSARIKDSNIEITELGESLFIGDNDSEYKVEHPSDTQDEATGVTEDKETSGDPDQDTQECDGFIMRISRSSSFACPQPPRPVNRSSSLHLQSSTFHQPRLTLPSPEEQRELILTNVQQHIDILNQHQMSVMKFIRNDQ